MSITPERAAHVILSGYRISTEENHGEEEEPASSGDKATHRAAAPVGEAARNQATGGAGLGLKIAQRIMTAHGGWLTAANREEGGALFSGVLPCAATADDAGANRAAASRWSAGANSAGD